MSALSVVLLFLVFSFATSSPVTETDRSNRIVNGFIIDISEVPYHAALRRKSSSGWSYTCGAAVITTRTALTAGHCVKTIENDPSSLRITVGSSSRLSGGDTYEISKVYVHEEYSVITLEHDIALLVTATKISFGNNVDAVFIAEPNFNIPVGRSALVSGFGVTSVRKYTSLNYFIIINIGNLIVINIKLMSYCLFNQLLNKLNIFQYGGPPSSTLLAANVDIVSQESCSRAYRRIARISSGMICASANNPPRDACQGDSGGPLVVDKTLIGIVSWGEECANSTYPGVYTRVSNYYAWVINKLVLI
ncbi:trypsin-3-like [Vanessa cardui]|uniref:trypsin-3-like n=1 Tax=Vanessa cardui TaxID=171605 RepID=UPI001F135FAD|nr:trypsin-3-like [Vanessa cardui]